MMTYFPWVALLAALVANGAFAVAQAEDGDIAAGPDDAVRDGPECVLACGRPPDVLCLGAPGGLDPARDGDAAPACRDRREGPEDAGDAGVLKGAPAAGFVAAATALATVALVRARLQ